MRDMEDLSRRFSALTLYRAGYSDQEVAAALEVSVEQLKREMALDPDWADHVIAAQDQAFEPILRHAMDLAKYADVEGENRGAHNAMNDLFRYAIKREDRRGRLKEIQLKAQLQDQLGQAGGKGGVVMPGQVKDVLEKVAAAALAAAEAETIELDSEEVTDDADDDGAAE